MSDPGAQVSHEIYADNLLLGKSMLLTLHLPPAWQLAPGVGRPEVVATHERGGSTWVVTGDAWYVLVEEERRWALEMAVRVRPPGQGGTLPGGEAVSVAGHPGVLRWRERRRGLPWKRHRVTFMTLDFDCPHSERSIRLDFSGWCPRAGFQEILQAAGGTQGH